MTSYYHEFIKKDNASKPDIGTFSVCSPLTNGQSGECLSCSDLKQKHTIDYTEQYNITFKYCDWVWVRRQKT